MCIYLSPVPGTVSEMRARLAVYSERKLLISALRNEDEKMSENAGRKDVGGIRFIITRLFPAVT